MLRRFTKAITKMKSVFAVIILLIFWEVGGNGQGSLLLTDQYTDFHLLKEPHLASRYLYFSPQFNYVYSNLSKEQIVMFPLLFNTNIISNHSFFLEQAANACLSPLHYFFHGRIVEVYNHKVQKEYLSFPERNWKKTALAMTLLIPGCLIGIPAKLLSYCFASARRHYGVVKEHDQQTLLLKECEVLNFDLIYQSDPTGFAYSLPRSILESFLSGKAFDHKEFYSQEDLQNLKVDICNLYQAIIDERPVKERLAIMTAGAPGTGKTILLKQDLEAQAKQGKVFAYVCPDDVCLKRQLRTYQKEIAERVDQGLMDDIERRNRRQEAYNKWRPGSNAATHLILAHLIRQRYGFYFGTTSSAPTTAKFLEFLKNHGYKIRLLHLTSPDQVRWESILERDKIFVQTTEEDIREKGKLVPQRIMDTYLKFADEIEFFYRGAVKENAVLAATWKRSLDSTEGLGTLTIVDRERYEAIKKIHNAACEALGKPELLWEMAVEKSSRVIDQ